MKVSFVLRLEPDRLTNPDLDLRYLLPDTIVARSKGALRDDAYDYGPGDDPPMFVFLTADDEAAVRWIVGVLETERVLGNDLKHVPVGVVEGASARVVYPRELAGTVFPLPGKLESVRTRRR